MSDIKFSVDEILDEYSKRKDEPTKPKSSYDVDELLSSTDKGKNKKDSKAFEFDKEDTLRKEMLFDNTQAILSQYSKPKPKKDEETDNVNTSFDDTQSILTQYSNQKSNKEADYETTPSFDDTQSILTQYSKTENKESADEHEDNLSAYLGNTQSILKQYSKKEEKTDKKINASNLTENNNQHSTKNVHKANDTQALSLEEKLSKSNVKPLKKSSGNTEIIEGILKLKKERVLSKTAELVPINRKNINDIHLDITSKIIPKTEQISIPDTADELTKMSMLAEKRNKRIKDFVLSSDVDDNDEEAEIQEEEYDTLDDFNDIEDAPNIANELSQLKGSFVIKVCFMLIATVLSSYIAFANDFSWPVPGLLHIDTSPTSFLFVNIVIGILCLFVCGSVVKNGMAGFFTLNADGDSLPAIAIVTSLITSIVYFAETPLIKNNKIHIFIPVAIGCLLFNTIGKLLIVSRAEKNFKYISDDNEKYALFQIDDTEKAAKFTRGALSGYPSLTAMREAGFVENFMKSSFSSDLTDTYCRKAVPAIFLSSLGIALISLVMNNNMEMTTRIFAALSTLTGTIALCASFAVMLIVNLPFARLTKKMLLSSACVLSYDGVEDFSDTNSVLLDVNQLFPEGSVELINLKQLSAATIEEGILIAASLSCHAGSVLKSTFYKMLKGNTEMLYPVESYLYEDTLGLSGWISNKRVLLGTREFMKNHSIEGLPSTAKEADYANGNTVLYLSVSGEATTMFIVKVKASIGVSKWLRELVRNDITIVLRSVDSIISLNLLSDLFHIPTDYFKLIPFRHHVDFEAQTAYTPKSSSPMICSGRFQSFASLITHVRSLNKTAIAGMFFVLTSCIMGILLSLCMTFLSSFSQISASVALLFNMGWVAILLLFLMFRRK